MQSDQITEIKNLLMQMQTEEVSQAEAKLAAYAKYPEFLQIIVEIIRTPSEDEWLRTVAASLLNSTLMNCTNEDTPQLSQVLRTVLCDPSIKQLDKRCLEKSIIKMIAQGGEQLHREWQQLIEEFLKSKHNFDSAYLVLACFAAADEVPFIILRGLIQNCFEPILCSLEVSLENANLLNEMIKMWIVIFDSLRRDSENNESLYFMSNSRKLLDLIDLLYEFETIDGVIVCLNPNLFELNLLKYEAAELNKRLLIFANEFPSRCETLEEYLLKNFNKFARTLHVLSLQREHLETLSCEDLLTTLLSLQQLYLQLSPEHFNYEAAISLIENEIFPYLPVNDEEREKFQESPEEFNSLAEDCCDKQTFGILKTEALKLLETIGDKIEGCFKYIFNRAIESIKINLGFVSVYSGVGVILSVETALLILSVFSYGIAHFEAELNSIKVMFCDERIKKLPPFEISRVFTFLGYNYSEIYNNPSDGESWIGFALTYQVHPTTAYCGFDFLSNIVDDHFSEAFLEALISQIVTSKISLIWEITEKVINHHFSKLSTNGVNLIISKLFERLQTEVRLIESQEKGHTLDLSNCISQFTTILSALSEEEIEGNEGRRQQILASVWPIIELYRPSIKWNLQDEIVKVVISIIEVLPSIVPELHSLVPQFRALFSTNGYYEKIYLRFFNQFALKADFTRDQQSLIDVIIAMKDALQNSINLISFGENGKYKGTQSERITAGNILIILQNILAVHGNNLVQSNSLEIFDEIGALCLRLLPNVDQQAERTSSGRIIMSRALNLLFLCHLHSKTNCFFDYLVRLNSENLYHGHDTRVFVLCAAKEIFREVDFAAITCLIESMMQIIGRSSEKDEVLENKKKGKAKIRLHNQLKKIGDMDKILKSIDSPFFGESTLGDEIINLISSMHSGNSEMVSQLFKSLTPDSLAILTRYVDLDGLGKKRRVFRRVVGIKEGAHPDDHQQQKPNKSSKYMEDEEDSDEEVGPKRQRTKIKVEGKKKSTVRKMHH